MRNLTITRRKSLAGCAMKLQVYIKDEIAGDLMINNVPCRKLGDLKNKEEKTFCIGTEETVLFVIADKLSRNLCNDSYTIPAGEEDVSLSGRNHFNPFAGNPFYFDGNTTPETKKQRNKSKWLFALIVCACVIGGLLVGKLIGSAVGKAANSAMDALQSSPKTFAVENMQITLTEAFEDFENPSFNGCFVSKDVGVMILKEPFSLMDGFEDYTLEDYANAVITNNALTGATTQVVDGLTCFEYQTVNQEDGNTYYYLATVFKEDDAFWMVQFGTVVDLADKYSAQFLDWAKTITFAEP